MLEASNRIAAETRPNHSVARFSRDDGQAAVYDTVDETAAIFDAEHRLVHGTALYFDILQYPLALRQRGTPLTECQHHEAGLGTAAAAGSDGPVVGLRTADGRTLSIRTATLPDGGLVRMVEVQTGEGLAGDDGDAPLAHLAAGSGLEMIEALDAMADGFVYFDADDRLALFNAKYKEFYQPIADKIVIGTPFVELIRSALACGVIVPQNRTAEEYLEWRIEQRVQPTLQFETKLASGQWLNVNEHRTKGGGIVSVQSEITVLKEREAALRNISQELGQQNVLFDAALNNMVQGLCMFDANQKLIVVNKRYLDLYKFSPQVVKPGISLREVMEYSVAIGNYSGDEADRALAERPTQAMKREHTVLLQRLKDGRVIAVMHSPLPNGGSVATYEDVTLREQIEMTLRQYASRLEASNRELQDFAFVASHDLQEPLRKIESFGSRLQAKFSDQLGEEGQLYLERMQNAATRMRGLISDLLSYSRITSKAQPFETLELETILREVISDLQVAIEEADAQINIGSLPILQADPTQIRQLLQNLISNSLKFRKKDISSVITIEARLFDQAVNLDETREFCEITIKDNGIGFDNKYADRIFAIFQRLHGKGEYEGTGIGLATVRKIVERHCGTIKAEGVPGSGATFTIVLPTKHSDQAE